MLSIIFPPEPKFTEKDLPNLEDKVIIITGAASGVGYELAKMLYQAGGTVYIAARSAQRSEEAIKRIKSEIIATNITRSGELKSMSIDLADLRTVKPAVERFLQQETRLDILVHNAGVMDPEPGSKDSLVRSINIFPVKI
jgi:retinol dehydrogenase-12